MTFDMKPYFDKINEILDNAPDDLTLMHKFLECVNEFSKDGLDNGKHIYSELSALPEDKISGKDMEYDQEITIGAIVSTHHNLLPELVKRSPEKVVIKIEHYHGGKVVYTDFDWFDRKFDEKWITEEDLLWIQGLSRMITVQKHKCLIPEIAKRNKRINDDVSTHTL
jgi:hypothetical protein